MLALDADVCIYAVTETPWTKATRRHLAAHRGELVGSLMLPVELLPHALRHGRGVEYEALNDLLRQVTLIPVSAPIAAVAVDLAARYHLRSVDAVHLGTAVSAGAAAFLTNNTRDFDAAAVDEIQIRHPR